jgi:uncharacterized protein (TIGR02246 family)
MEHLDMGALRSSLAVASLVFVAGLGRADGREPAKNDNQRAKGSAVTSELEQLSERWYRAWVERDPATVERMMADDYVYVSPTGQAQSREAILRIIKSPRYRLNHFDRTNVVVRMLGDDAAVIRLRGRDDGEFEGKRFNEDHACLQVWSRARGQWQLVLEQCTDNKP